MLSVVETDILRRDTNEPKVGGREKHLRQEREGEKLQKR